MAARGARVPVFSVACYLTSDPWFEGKDWVERYRGPGRREVSVTCCLLPVP